MNLIFPLSEVRDHRAQTMKAKIILVLVLALQVAKTLSFVIINKMEMSEVYAMKTNDLSLNKTVRERFSPLKYLKIPFKSNQRFPFRRRRKVEGETSRFTETISRLRMRFSYFAFTFAPGSLLRF